MSEFRIHHDVNELLSLLRVHGGEGAEVYIDLLQKNRTPYVTTTVSAHSAKVSARPAPLRVYFPTGRPGRSGDEAREPWRVSCGPRGSPAPQPRQRGRRKLREPRPFTTPSNPTTGACSRVSDV